MICLISFSSCGGDSDSSGNISDDSSENPTEETTEGTTENTSENDSGDDSENTNNDLSDSTIITLNKDSITVEGDNVSVSGMVATITSSGVYSISGTLNDGQVKVATTDGGEVYLYLNGVDITSSSASPLDIESAEKVIIYLADNTDNYLTDGETNTSVDEDGEPIDAALFSKDDILITGQGSLTVDANNNNGIKSKDGLVIESGIINITSVDDGIIGKNYIIIEDGEINITAQGDGMKSTDDDVTKGYITIEDGIIDIVAGADAIQAETDIMINDGEFMLITGGGSETTLAEDATAKGIKAPVGITINGGVFTIDSADDAIHSNDTITINGGDYSIATGDDAMHSETELTINAGDIDITNSYEGIESYSITITGGNININAYEDGINASDGTLMDHGPWPFNMSGGYVAMEAGGDGVDVGVIDMSGGELIIHGTSRNMDGVIDYTSSAVSGGFIIAAGSKEMAKPPGGTDSTQCSLILIFSARQTAGKLFHIETSSGTEVVTFAPIKTYESIAFSSPLLEIGEEYNVYTGGIYSNGTVTDGIYQGGTYNNGMLYTTFTISSVVTEL